MSPWQHPVIVLNDIDFSQLQVEYSTVQYSTVKHSTVQCSTVQYSIVLQIDIMLKGGKP